VTVLAWPNDVVACDRRSGYEVRIIWPALAGNARALMIATQTARTVAHGLLAGGRNQPLGGPHHSARYREPTWNNGQTASTPNTGVHSPVQARISAMNSGYYR